MEPVYLPVIKNIKLGIIADTIIGVQPMMNHVSNFNLKISKNCKEEAYKEGAIRHSFLDGWQRFYGGTWISIDDWWKLKIAGL